MAAAVLITRLDLSAAELRRPAVRISDPDVTRRVPALALVLEGASREEAARACGMDRQTLRDWVHRYNAEGVAGLSDRKPPGEQPKLRPDQKAEAAFRVRAGPDGVADGAVRWRRRDLARKIEQRSGAVLTERSVGALPHGLGFRRLQVAESDHAVVILDGAGWHQPATNSRLPATPAFSTCCPAARNST